MDLNSGLTADKWQTAARIEPNLTLNLDSWHLFAGGIGSYDQTRKGAIYGGFIGAGKEIGRNNEANLKIDYTNLSGLNIQARYFFNTESFGVGPLISGNYNPSDKQYSLGGGMMGRISFGNRFHILPYVQSLYSSGVEGKSVNFGLVIRWGDLQLADYSPLCPYSLKPLPEGR